MIDNRFNSLKEAMPGVIATKNKTGFMTTELSDTAKQYIEFAESCDSVLEIGCAYGITVFPVLDFEKVTVNVVDLSEDHLNFIRSQLTPAQKMYFRPSIGNFPKDVGYGPNSFDAIYIGNVLHFLRGEYVTWGLERCFQWLKPGGKIFATVCSPYFPSYTKFVDLYHQRQKCKVRWPGEMENHQDYIPDDAPEAQKQADIDYLHVFTKEDLADKFREVGFAIEQSTYFALETATHLKYTDDSRSFVGIIAKKP